MGIVAEQPDKLQSKFAVLLTCYMTGSTEGKNLGTAGYSYDFVAKLFSELLSRWGKVIPVPNPEANLELAAEQARSEGLEPIHVSFLPFQDVVLCQSAPNVVVPAWEFPDIPNQVLNGDERNDWIGMSNKCDMVIVGGPFTVDSFRRGGVEKPIRVVPVPTSDGYFQVPAWKQGQTRVVNCRAFWPDRRNFEETRSTYGRKDCLRDARHSMRHMIRALNKFVAGPENYEKVSEALKKRRIERRKRQGRLSRGPEQMSLSIPSTPELELSGIVYTSIFNPDDGRKNWSDMLNAYLVALADCEDATLVFKLITRRRDAVEWVIRYYQDRDIPHRCKVAFVVDFLSEKQMQDLAAASTYYLQTTRAEGNCLPLMNFLAAARPGISPDHSALGDYFDDYVGWVVRSSQEPAAWPHDPYLRLRTTWGRMDWTSVRDCIRESYDVAKHDSAHYMQLAKQSRQRMQNWASNEAVWKRLEAAMNDLVTGNLSRDAETPSDEMLRIIKFPSTKAA
jgi:glycosyltransferase involved in cell wall biosynthesis